MTIAALALCIAGALAGHGGTTHSKDMDVSNVLELAADHVTLTQTHRCRGAIARSVWDSADADHDGSIAPAERQRAVTDATLIFLRFCRMELDWKEVPPSPLVVSFPTLPDRQPPLPAPLEVTVEHRGTYSISVDTGGAGGAAVSAGSGVHLAILRDSDLNASRIDTHVQAGPGVRVLAWNLGEIRPGIGLDGLQTDGAPDTVQIIFAVRGGAPGAGAAPTGAAAEGTGGPDAGSLQVWKALLAAFALGVVSTILIGNRHRERSTALSGPR